MLRVLRGFATGLLALLTMVASGTSAQRHEDGAATLAVSGRTNATPWIAAHGRFIAAAWGASTPDGKTDVFLATSRDGGSTFGTPVRVNRQPGEAQLGGERTPRVDLVSTAASTPDIVVLWTAATPAAVIRLARSHDGGRTFTPSNELQRNGAAGNRGWASLAADSRGGVHAFWLDHRGMAGSTTGGQHVHEGHAAAETGQKGTGNAAPHDGAAMAQRSGLYYAGGMGALVEREIARGVCYCCKTTVATGPGGAIAAAWRHVYPGNLRDIAFTISRDNGRSFSPAARVSQDGWAIDGCPEDGPSVVIDAASTAHIVWPTVVGSGEPIGALFYASTRDGRAFTARQRIPTLGGPKPAHPNLAIGPDGRLVVAWDEFVNGQRIAAARAIQPSAGGTATFGGVVRLGAGTAAMYPSIAATSDGIVVAWTSGPSRESTIHVQRVPF